jgi:hypothetical protein
VPRQIRCVFHITCSTTLGSLLGKYFVVDMSFGDRILKAALGCERLIRGEYTHRMTFSLDKLGAKRSLCLSLPRFVGELLVRSHQ